MNALKTEAIAGSTHHRADGLEYKCDAVGPLGVGAAEINFKLIIERLTKVNFVDVPYGARLKILVGCERVAIAVLLKSIAIDVIGFIRRRLCLQYKG